jgi:hypothetical protein
MQMDTTNGIWHFLQESQYVVKEYIEIIKSYEKGKGNKTDLENQ